MVVTITSFVVKANVPAMLCTILCTVQSIVQVCSEGREPLTLCLCILIDLEGYSPIV